MRKRKKGPVRDLLEVVVIALVMAMLIRTFLVEVYRVYGSSMARTLHDGERVIVSKFIYRWFRKPKPGDIILFRYPRSPDREFIKRVVAVAGDKVQIRAGKVYVNEMLLPEAPQALLGRADMSVRLVEPDAVWVLGDNRENSEDSRAFGAVPIANVDGQVVVRFWPLARACRFVYPEERGGFICP